MLRYAATARSLTAIDPNARPRRAESASRLAGLPTGSPRSRRLAMADLILALFCFTAARVNAPQARSTSRLVQGESHAISPTFHSRIALTNVESPANGASFAM